MPNAAEVAIPIVPTVFSENRKQQPNARETENNSFRTAHTIPIWVCQTLDQRKFHFGRFGPIFGRFGPIFGRFVFCPKPIVETSVLEKPIVETGFGKIYFKSSFQKRVSKKRFSKKRFSKKRFSKKLFFPLKYLS